MGTVTAILGFTTFESTLWNLLAYCAIIGISTGALFEKYRFTLFALGGLALVPYSYFFLNNVIFAVSNTIASTSAIFQICKVKERHSKKILAMFAVFAVVFLFFVGFLDTMLEVVGVLGFGCLTLGTILLPKPSGFIILAGGGFLLTVYAFDTGAWMFFVLNMFFAIVNMWQLAALIVKMENNNNFNVTKNTP